MKEMIVVNILEITEIFDNSSYLLDDAFSFELFEDKVIYNNDGTFNRVKIEKNIFVNVSKINLNKLTLNILKKFIGKVFVINESGTKVFFGKDFLGEYVYSKYTISLNYVNKIVKFRIIDNLENIVGYATERKWEKNRKKKHDVDGAFGFYKYKIVFSIVYEGVEKIYDGVLLIRNDANGKKYLYDILDIKEKID